MIGVFDLDAIKYTVASVGEKKSIIAHNKVTGDAHPFKTRTEFYGRGKKKDGGWLGTQNFANDTNYTVDDFDIEDVVVLEPLPNIFHTAKLLVDKIISESGAKSWYGGIGKGESMRVAKSTLLEYKGTRNVKPYYIDDVIDYLERKYKPEIITGIECDDWLVMETINDKNKFVIVEDKDMLGTPINVYNFNRPSDGIVDCRGFGSIWKDTVTTKTPKVWGKGRMFKYYQIISEDKVDNFKANCFSEIPWGSVSAYDSLVNCKDDKEAFQAMKGVFKTLYPEPKTITGWRGDQIEIDWLYVFGEMMDMAHLHRWENDWLDVKSILDKLGVEY